MRGARADSPVLELGVQSYGLGQGPWSGAWLGLNLRPAACGSANLHCRTLIQFSGLRHLVVYSGQMIAF